MQNQYLVYIVLPSCVHLFNQNMQFTFLSRNIKESAGLKVGQENHALVVCCKSRIYYSRVFMTWG